MNRFRQLKDLLDTDTVDIVTVSSVEADGTSTVQDLAGNTYTVRGDSVPAGQKAYVKGGIIQGAAPSLPYSTITL